MTFEIVHSLPKLIWRRYVDQHPGGNIFHTPEMYDVFSRGGSYQPRLWAVVDGQYNPLVLLLPVILTLKGGVFRYFTSRAVVYGSVLFNPNSEGVKELRNLLVQYTKENHSRLLFTELRNMADLSDVQNILNRQKFVYEDHLNYLVDLDLSPDAVFKNIGQRTRKNIRRGLNKGKVVIKQVTERNEIVRCYCLLKQTYQAVQVPLADISLFESAFDILYPKGMIRFSLALLGDKVAATSIDLIYKDVIYGWYGGTDRKFANYVPNEILTWSILKWGAENGFRVYDFGGAGKPEEAYGVREFKAKFGGRLVNYGRNTYVHTPKRLELSKIGYKFMRRWL